MTVGRSTGFDTVLAEVFGDLAGLDIDVWWRDTLDRHLEGQQALQWSYPQILSGTQVMSLLLAAMSGEHAARRDRAVRAFLAAQLSDEMQLRFKQIGLEAATLFDLFVDVPAAPDAPAYVLSSAPWRHMAAAADDATQLDDAGAANGAASPGAGRQSTTPCTTSLVEQAESAGATSASELVAALNLRAALDGAFLAGRVVRYRQTAPADIAATTDAQSALTAEPRGGRPRRPSPRGPR